MWRVSRRRRVVFISFTATEVLIINVGRGCSIHHGRVVVCLPRVVEDQWRREVHGLASGRMLDVMLSEDGLLTGLQLKELLIHMLLVGANLLCIVLPNIEASEEVLR
jgi:hypothetical protein